MTVVENLRAAARLYGITDIKNRIDSYLGRSGLEGRRRDLVKNLSGGLARRVELVKALLPKPRILILDEPTSGLDPVARRGFWEQIEAEREERELIVLVTTHLMDEAEQCDRVAILLPSDLVPVGDLVVGVCEYLGVSHVRAYPFTTGIADWDRIAEMWRTFRPTVVFVAPGVAMHMTRLAKSRGELADLRSSTRVLMLLGEVSTEPFRDRLGQWWGGEVHDASYGSTETGTLAATCARSRLHLLPSAAYFELSDGTSTTPARGSGAGNLVVTPLRLPARPLLRVDTGDVVDLEVGCPCGSAVPIVQVHGRAAEEITVSGVALAVRDVETIVFGSAPVTTYLVEVDETRDCARLLLERDVDSDREQEPLLADRIRRHSQEHLGLEWDDVVFLNSLPAAAKSGASQKSWKRSNVRFVGADR